jgi:hypothetical protein
MFRCTECGRTFPISFGEPEVSSSAPEAAPAQEAESEGLLLKQDGQVYHVKDMAKLQRWIAERRVLGTDEVSRAGGEWQAVGDLEELGVFFKLLDQADHLEDPDPVPDDSEPAELTGSADHTDIIVEPEPQAVDLELEPQAVALPTVELNFPDESPEVAEIALEGIPDESELPPLSSAALGPDDPTMDLGAGGGDFFSEEAIFDAHTEEYDADEDPDFVWVKQRRRQTFLWWGMLFVAGTGIGIWGFDYLNSMDKGKAQTISQKTSASAVEEAPADPPAQAEAEPVAGEVASAPGSELEGQTPPEAETLAPEAAVAAAPAQPEVIQEPAAPKEEKKKEKKSARAENGKGWQAVDSKKWAQARKHFETALDAKGGTESRFGLAYVIEHQGNTGRASGMYCKIAKTGRGEFQREAAGRLRKLRHTCP